MHPQKWRELTTWSSTVSDRDVSDEAHRWADEEALAVAMPENIGEWKASLAMAFEAGRRLERMGRQ